MSVNTEHMKAYAADAVESVKSDLAQQIKEKLKENRMSQVMLSEISGIHNTDISQIVNGRLEKKSIERLIYLLTCINSNINVTVKVKAVRRKR